MNLGNGEIISNDPDLKITSYRNAKGVLTNIFKKRNYRSVKDCIYDLYGTVIYNSIKDSHRSRILYEYFNNKNNERYLSIINELSDNINEFSDFCSRLKYVDEFIKEKDLFDKDICNKIYEIYLKRRNVNYEIFSETFHLNKYTVFTPLDNIRKIPNFSYEFYYQVLKEISEENGFTNLEEKILYFYFMIQDLYFDGKIYLKMNFEEVKRYFLDDPIYKILKKSKYNPSDIYYCFMMALEERLCKLDINDPKLSDLDRNAIQLYLERMENTKEEGEL
ncbi:hypothetical protein P3W45_000531 [Vairimorpha bombi]